MVGVYQIHNTKNNKRYIGSSADLSRRRRVHLCELKRGNHYNKHLQRSWDKYGEDNFVFESLLICEASSLLFYEQWFLDYEKPEYNIAKDARSPGPGLKHTVEAKAKISKARTGMKFSDEHKAKLKEAWKMRPPMSNETRKRRSKALMGNTRAQGTRSGSVKLSELDVHEIRRLWATGKVSQRALGEMFKVSSGHAGRIVRRKKWMHL